LAIKLRLCILLLYVRSKRSLNLFYDFCKSLLSRLFWYLLYGHTMPTHVFVQIIKCTAEHDFVQLMLHCGRAKSFGIKNIMMYLFMLCTTLTANSTVYAANDLTVLPRVAAILVLGD
jgi:hypothetical protein